MYLHGDGRTGDVLEKKQFLFGPLTCLFRFAALQLSWGNTSPPHPTQQNCLIITYIIFTILKWSIPHMCIFVYMWNIIIYDSVLISLHICPYHICICQDAFLSWYNWPYCHCLNCVLVLAVLIPHWLLLVLFYYMMLHLTLHSCYVCLLSGCIRVS